MSDLLEPHAIEEVMPQATSVAQSEAVDGQNASESPELELQWTTAMRSIERDEVVPQASCVAENKAADHQNTSRHVQANETHPPPPLADMQDTVETTSQDASPHGMNEHDTRETAPSEIGRPIPSKKLELVSTRVSLNYELWLAVIATIGTSAFQLMFWNGVMSQRGIALLFMNIDPKWKIFVIALVGTIVTFLLNWLITATFESMKWRLTLRKEGISLLDFIALSQSTPLSTLARFVVVRPWKFYNGSSSETVKSMFRIYSLMR